VAPSRSFRESPHFLPRRPDKPIEPDAARTGTASSPLPMDPRAKITLARLPAIGLSELAAWAAL
jgi:hypothetical protein